MTVSRNNKPTKYVDDNFIKERTIAFRGIDFFWEDADDCNPPCFGWAPIFPNMDEVCDLVVSNPDLTDVTWDGERWKETNKDNRYYG